MAPRKMLLNKEEWKSLKHKTIRFPDIDKVQYSIQHQQKIPKCFSNTNLINKDEIIQIISCNNRYEYEGSPRTTDIHKQTSTKQTNMNRLLYKKEHTGEDIPECMTIRNVSSLNQSSSIKKELFSCKTTNFNGFDQHRKTLSRKVYLKWTNYTNQTKVSKNVSTLNDRNKNSDIIMRKYWTLWKGRVLKKHKIEKCTVERTNTEDNIIHKSHVYNENQNKSVQLKNSELFITNRMQSYSADSRRIYNRSQNSINQHTQKIKVQRHIIENQKAKLDEQNKIIDELKLTQLQLETEKFSKESEQILKLSFSNSERRTKEKAQNLLNNYCIKKVSSVERYKNMWDMVDKMEERARERREKWEKMQQKKQELEDEKVAKMKMKEEQEKQRMEEEKRQKLREMKAQKKKQIEMKKKQEEEREHFKNLNMLATQHYRRTLLIKSFHRLQLNVEYFKMLDKKATKHYNRTILCKYFQKWRLFAYVEVEKKLIIADSFYKMKLIRLCFEQFKKIHSECLYNYQAATDMYNHKLIKNSFYSWQCFVYKQQYERTKREKQLSEQYNRKLMKRCFDCWKNFKNILFLEREKEQRLRSWRDKVQEMLPDYEPTEVIEISVPIDN